MHTDESKALQSIDVELVDSWHARWPDVLAVIDHLGARQRLEVENDGWLSARHNLLVAFADESIAGHLSFRVQPVRSIPATGPFEMHSCVRQVVRIECTYT